MQEKSLESKEEREKDIQWFFNFTLWLKAVNGVLEMTVAFLVLFVSPSLVNRLVEFSTAGEVSRDLNDPVMTAIRNAAHTFAIHTHYLLAIYLVFHGAVKVILVVGIFTGVRIAYPLFMIALALFGSYEAYRGFVQQESLLQVLAIFDFSVLLLTAYEYRRRYPIAPSSFDTR